MKTKKFIVALLAAILAVGAVFALTACGPEDDKKDDDKTTTSTKSYQLVGSFTDSLGPLGDGFEFMLNLNTDGTAVLSRYNPYSYDSSDAATNTSFDEKFMEGTWKEAEKDGVDCLQIKLEVRKEDGTTSDATTSYAYDVAGEYSFDLTFPIVPGMAFTRQVTLKGGETKKYADANAFIKGTCKTFTAPESIATFEAENGGTAYVQEDGTVLLYSGYTEFATGTYYKTADDFGIVIGGEEVEVTKEGNKASFTYTYSMGGGYEQEYTFVCDDISVLPDKAPAGGEEEETPEPGTDDKTLVGTYEGTNQPKPTDTVRKYKIELYDDNTCTLTFNFMTNIIFECKYTKDGNVVTLSDLTTDNPYGGQLKGMAEEALVWTLGDDGTMTPVTAAEA